MGLFLGGALPLQCGMRAGQMKLVVTSCSTLLHASNGSVIRASGSIAPSMCNGRGVMGPHWRSLWSNAAAGSGVSGGCNRRTPAGGSSRGIVGGAGGATLASATGPASAGTARGGGGPRAGPRVCILGGGFGGLYTAVRLDQLLWPRENKPQVTLIDQSERFVFKPLLYDLLAGVAQPWEVAPAFAQLLSPYNINFVKGAVASVEAQETLNDGGSATGGLITLADGQTVEYDWLVLALGAETATFGIPGVRELALPFCTYDDAVKVMDELHVLMERPDPAEVVVVGGGYAGVELAATVAEKLAGKGQVKLVTMSDDILRGSPADQAQAARSVLRGKAVTIIANAGVSSIQRPGEAAQGEAQRSRRLVHLDMEGGTKQLLEADMVLWTAGSKPVSSAHNKVKLPFEVNKRGAAETDSTLRVRKHSRVFALGDVSGIDVPLQDGALPATAQVAFQQADYVAWNVWAAINGRPLLPFKYQHLGDMMSLGAVNGAVTLPLPVPGALANSLQAGPVADLLKLAGVKVGAEGSGSGVTLDGPLAGTLRRAAYLYRQPTDEHRVRVGVAWLEQIAAAGADAAQRLISGNPPFNAKP